MMVQSPQNENADSNEHFWSIDFPGLTAQGAQKIADTVNSGMFGVDALPVDPHEWFSLHVDAATAKVLLSGVKALLESTDVDANGVDRDGVSLMGIIESIEDWILWRSGNGRAVLFSLDGECSK
ncbi:hypothetical protein ACFQ3B_15605 [Stackebrandtia endophytica]|uniref:hypothetical protein n=1 Tax=Stackebrandtia endophytica TaxID=1496996 RepID=UPI00114FA2C8|nr:hypothetical protein [Stackebrandtia endophytica]